MFARHDSLLRMAAEVLKAKVFSAFLNFIAAVALVRYIPKQEYGLLSLVIASFGIFQVLITGLDPSIIRYASTANRGTRYRVIAGVLLAKLVIVGAGIAISQLLLRQFSYLLQIPDHLYSQFRLLFMISAANLILVSLVSSLRAAMSSQLLYNRIFRITVIDSALGVAAVAAVIFWGGDVVLFFSLSQIPNLVFIALSIRALQQHDPFLFPMVYRSLQLRVARYVYSKQIGRFSLPLIASDLLAYGKRYLPNLLVGSQVGLESLASFTILREFFTLIHKQLDGITEQLYPKLFLLAEKYREAFIGRLRSLIAAGFALRALLALVFAALLVPICELYKVPITPEILTVGYILLLDFALGFFLSLSKFLLWFTHNTTRFAGAAFVHLFVVVVVSWVLIEGYGEIGAAWAVTAGTAATAFTSLWKLDLRAATKEVKVEEMRSFDT